MFAPRRRMEKSNEVACKVASVENGKWYPVGTGEGTKHH